MDDSGADDEAKEAKWKEDGRGLGSNRWCWYSKSMLFQRKVGDKREKSEKKGKQREDAAMQAMEGKGGNGTCQWRVVGRGEVRKEEWRERLVCRR